MELFIESYASSLGLRIPPKYKLLAPFKGASSNHPLCGWYLIEGGNKKAAIELENVAKVLEQAELSTSKEEIKKKVLINRLGRLIKDLKNEDSQLHKTVKGIKNGIGIAQDIAEGYNKIAEWVGLPPVPKPFLKK